MSIQLTLICHGATGAIREASFPADDGLDAAGLRAAQTEAGVIRRVDLAWVGPGRAARETAEAIGLDAREAAGLREIDYGSWAGRGMEDVGAADPVGFAAWLGDPHAAPHGGESIGRAVTRMAAWMEGLQAGRVVAVVPVSLARAAVVVALSAPMAAFWRIDLAPLGRVVLNGRKQVWTLRMVGRSSGRSEASSTPGPLPEEAG